MKPLCEWFYIPYHADLLWLHSLPHKKKAYNVRSNESIPSYFSTIPQTRALTKKKVQENVFVVIEAVEKK